MRITMSRALQGSYSYWFVSPSNQASKLKPLPSPGANGLLMLTIPAPYNRPGAQLRVMDARLGKVAHLPVVDFSQQPVIDQQQVGSNRLQNPDFARNLEAWTVEAAPNTGVKTQILDGLDTPPGVAGQVAHFDVTALGAQDWHVQCYQKGIDLTEGRQYLLAFWAKADRNRPLRVDTTLDHPDFHKVGLDQSFALTPQWQKCEVKFTTVRTEPNHTHLSFALGGALGSVELAGISLRQVTGADVLQPASPKAALTLSAGDFN